ncbi:MAG: ATP-binding protein [Candidatus Woesearchaeota archaeon]|nr:ATP-binding protein [Candidatus Woesearchaeota archaeon]
MPFSLIAAYHGINKFLGTFSGDLLKKSIEFVLILIILYMLASEYRKEKSSELKYLIAGFFLLLLEKIVMVAILSQVVFVGPSNAAVIKYTPIITNMLEIVGMFIITTTLLSDLYRTTGTILKKGIIAGAVLYGITQAVWLAHIFFFPRDTLTISILFILFEVTKIAVLWYPIVYLIKHHKLTEYYKKVALAFGVYSVTPLVYLLNIVFFFGANKYLKVIAHPFPFLAMLLLLRVMFLKLADKALIKKDLELTQRRYEETKKISKMKDEFVSTVNHELRTPLTSMKLYLSLLRQGKMGALNADQQKAVDVVNKEAGRLAELISDILDVSKLESGKEKLTLAKTNLAALLDYTAYEKLIDEKKIRIKNMVPKKFLVVVDAARFKQVFVNLLSNAIKFSPEQGTITLDAERGKKVWQFWVQDEGPGIAKAHHTKIFEKFYQVEDYLTRTKGGTGLGLPITKKIVEMHKGTIRVESTPGKGSRFVVEMPL